MQFLILFFVFVLCGIAADINGKLEIMCGEPCVEKEETK